MCNVVVLAATGRVNVVTSCRGGLGGARAASNNTPRPGAGTRIRPTDRPGPRRVGRPTRKTRDTPSCTRPRNRDCAAPPRRNTCCTPRTGRTPRNGCGRPNCRTPPRRTCCTPRGNTRIPPCNVPRRPIRRGTDINLTVLSFFVPVTNLVVFLAGGGSEPGATGIDKVYTLMDFVLGVIVNIVNNIVNNITTAGVTRGPRRLSSCVSSTVNSGSSGLMSNSRLNGFIYSIASISGAASTGNGPTVVIACCFGGGSSATVSFSSTLCAVIGRGSGALVEAILNADSSASLTSAATARPNTASGIGETCALGSRADSIMFRLCSGASRGGVCCLRCAFALNG